MSKKEVKAIETEINYLLQAYDDAVKEGNNEIMLKSIECINYELEKLEENEIKLKTYNH